MMKKILVSVLFIIVFVFQFSGSVFANNEVTYQYKWLPSGSNYIGLDLLQREGDFLTLKAPIRIKSETTYTLIMSTVFLGQSLSVIDMIDELIIIDQSTTEETYAYFDELETHFYYTFTTGIDWQFIDFENLVGDIGNDEIMLYEGTIDDFDGYEAYLGPDYDQTNPVYGHMGVFLVNVDAPLDVEMIKESLRAFDNVDGDLTAQIMIENDTYTANATTLGDHEVIFIVIDSAGNEAQLSLLVRVVDVTAPIINGPDVLSLPLSEAIPSVFEIKSYLTAHDNIDGDLFESIVIDSDDFTGNETSPGIYDVTFSLEDSSGNKTYKSIQIEVIDDIAPVFHGPSDTKVYLRNPLIDVNILKDLVGATDNVDGDVTHNIYVSQDTYTGNERIPGVYSVVFAVIDDAGNMATHTLAVEVIDDLAPIIWVDKIVIPKTTADLLTLDEIKQLLIAHLKAEGTHVSTMEVTFDGYSEHASIEGRYYVHLQYRTPSGELGNERVAIWVQAEKTIDKAVDIKHVIYASLTICGLVGIVVFQTFKKK